MNQHETMAEAIQQLLNAKTIKEKKEAAQKVRLLCVRMPSPEERLEFYHLAIDMIWQHALYLLEKAEATPEIRAFLWELDRMTHTDSSTEIPVIELKPFLFLLHQLCPGSATLAGNKNPEQIKNIIEAAHSRLSKMENLNIRATGKALLQAMIETELLGKYLKYVSEGSIPNDGSIHTENYFPSLICALAVPSHPSLALAFLDYAPEKDCFYSVAPSKLAELNVPDAISGAIVTYRMALENASHQEAKDCAEELSYCILQRLVNWVDKENLTQFRDIGICVDTLKKILRGDYTLKTNWNRSEFAEPFSRVMNAIYSTLCLGTEAEEGTFDALCQEQAGIVLQCTFLNEALRDFTAFVLVTHLYQCLSFLEITLPPALEHLVRLYIVLTLSDYGLADPSFVWAM